MIEKDLNKYYTKPLIAKQCVEILQKELLETGFDVHYAFFIEPAAGNGSFLQFLPNNNFFACDIYPENNNIVSKDFINQNIQIDKNQNNIIIGNPPFGKKGQMALDFINKSFDYANIVAFILPVQFRKWGIQKRINQDVKLLYDSDLNPDSFILKDKNYNLQCCFQIWIHSSFNGFEAIKNKRLIEPPETNHKDFLLYQYNCTQQALKYFDYDWDFCVLRQGWGDFNKLFYPSERNRLSRKKQWMFFKAKNQTVLNQLIKMDFNHIANANTLTKGFGKADVIQYYKTIKK